jgi:hypothetical protein
MFPIDELFETYKLLSIAYVKGAGASKVALTDGFGCIRRKYRPDSTAN